MPTEMELTLEQTQQGVSYEVSNIRVNSFTMKMEILLESTSNKLHGRFNTTVGKPVKKILLKLNLSDHRLFKDGGGVPQDGKSYKMAKSLCLVVDLKMSRSHMSKYKLRNKLNQEVNDHYIISKRKSRVRAKD
ncbi:hypothetical protein Tco_0472199 [Tanacetum coccineum]